MSYRLRQLRSRSESVAAYQHCVDFKISHRCGGLEVERWTSIYHARHLPEMWIRDVFNSSKFYQVPTKQIFYFRPLLTMPSMEKFSSGVSLNFSSPLYLLLAGTFDMSIKKINIYSCSSWSFIRRGCTRSPSKLWKCSKCQSTHTACAEKDCYFVCARDRQSLGWSLFWKCLMRLVEWSRLESIRADGWQKLLFVCV